MPADAVLTNGMLALHARKDVGRAVGKASQAGSLAFQSTQVQLIGESDHSAADIPSTLTVNPNSAPQGVSKFSGIRAIRTFVLAVY